MTLSIQNRNIAVRGYKVMPGLNGSFILLVGSDEYDRPTGLGDKIGFSNWQDLVRFINNEHESASVGLQQGSQA